ncbi:MAG: FAD:protein FMN transferase [Brevinematia bacterium]
MVKKFLLVCLLVLVILSNSFSQVYQKFYTYESMPIIIKFTTNVDESFYNQIYSIVTNEIFNYSYRKGSYIYEITKSCYKKYVSINDDLDYMLGRLIYYNVLSKNAISPTVGYIIDLWGFESKNFYVPSLSEISNALRISSIKNLVVSGKKIALKNKETKFYLKPYAISLAMEKIKRLLLKNKVTNAFISVANYSLTMGEKEKEPWMVGIPNPLRLGEFYVNLEVKDSFVYTVDITENQFNDNFRTYHSIIDPRTGYPANNGVISVSVVGKDSLELVILARIIFVLGKDAGLKFAQKHSIPALILYSTGDKITEYKTIDWIKMFSKDTSEKIKIKNQK